MQQSISNVSGILFSNMYPHKRAITIKIPYMLRISDGNEIVERLELYHTRIKQNLQQHPISNLSYLLTITKPNIRRRFHIYWQGKSRINIKMFLLFVFNDDSKLEKG
ncbi:MAG TPA: hypothetical protein VIY08_00005 [Candidatus Nitrosocosmicus sp.]